MGECLSRSIEIYRWDALQSDGKFDGKNVALSSRLEFAVRSISGLTVDLECEIQHCFMTWRGRDSKGSWRYQYLRNPGIRDKIEAGVRLAMQPGVPTVVVSHSLGTVVAYNLLRREGVDKNWQVPLFVTLGSPLAVKAIRSALAPVEHPECASHWFNAMDERDVVALYPLTPKRFDVDPAIENKTDVPNDTENRHGISGYLGDAEVARRIAAAVAT